MSHRTYAQLSATLLLIGVGPSLRAEPPSSPPATALPAAALRWNTEPSGVRVANAIPYATAGGQKLLLDLAVPAGKGPFPVVLCFHGGAWRFGSRADVNTIALRLAENGYAAASVGYRLAPKFKFPAPLEDAKTAVRFLRHSAATFDLDPDRVAALGFSAGGHLAALLGTTDKSAGFDGPLYPEQSSRVRCVVDFFGPADMSLYATSEGLVDGYMVPFLGPACRTDASLFKKASPVEYVTAQSAPTLIVHGTADVIVPIVHSERFRDRLKAAGVPVEFLPVPWKGHGVWDADTTKQTALAARAFLDAHLKGKK